MTPRATYRLQFRKQFGFADAAALAPYLARLGVSHVYASSWLKARPGSTHGYDIVDHHAINPELGTADDFERMVAAFRKNGLRQVLDFVPNHMGVGGADNPLWLDVLEWGRDSTYAGWFDIDWQSDRQFLEEKLLVPFLGDQYGVELDAGKLVLKFDPEEGSFAVWAYDFHKLPICPLHYGRILGDAVPELERLGDAFANLPEWRPQAARRARELKALLAHAARESGEVRNGIALAVALYNGEASGPQGWDQLRALIRQQNWRAANFRVAADDINYRRFFDINDLAGLRMELPDVFEHAHRLVFQLLADGTLDGLRIDHVDGLLDPKEYFERLRSSPATGRTEDPFYLIIEKILARHEGLREDWPVDGSTGYEFANLLLGLLIDPAGEPGFSQTYRDFIGEQKEFSTIVRECKLRIMHNEMASELHALAREAERVAHQNPRTADFTQNGLQRAIREVVASFPVYRTYIDAQGALSDEGRRDLTWALKKVRTNSTDLDESVYDFVARLLSGDLVAQPHSGFSRQSVLRFARKVQQYSGPVMAKGLEDTAFYRYYRFVALNEVGGDPDQFGVTPANFHKANAQRLRRWPKSMLTTATHDTKRGEDTRARLTVLSELPDEWARQVQTWSRMLRARRGDLEASAPPDRNDEYLFYQLLLGAWPAELTGIGEPDPEALGRFAERLKGAMTKSMREAKVHSTWAAPNSAYESAVLSFVEGALNPEESRGFLSEFLPFQERIARLGVQNSLVQCTLKLTCPGVPDIYQGSELWDLSLVDPDNRRLVNYEDRSRLLESVGRAGGGEIESLLDNWRDGGIKLFVISKLLALRAAEPELFQGGEYEPLTAAGPKADRICGFVRRCGNRSVAVLAARFPVQAQADPGFAGTALPFDIVAGSALRNVFTGAEIPVANGAVDLDAAFGPLPVAVFAG